MTSIEFREACTQLGLTVAQSSDVLGLSVRTVRRYASGKQAIPETVARLMRNMVGSIDTPRNGSTE
jgi:transcriptional regulator with XRE-family HTH domain